MQICEEIIKVTTAGGAGVAAGNASLLRKIKGFLLDIFLDYNAAAPATTDVTITQVDRPGGNLLVVSNNATDGLYTPRTKPVDNANAPITNAFDKFPINGTINVAVAQCDALTDAVVAYIRYLRSG
jgi:hypothetical protein